MNSRAAEALGSLPPERLWSIQTKAAVAALRGQNGSCFKQVFGYAGQGVGLVASSPRSSAS